jgi:hypothetical protein
MSNGITPLKMTLFRILAVLCWEGEFDKTRYQIPDASKIKNKAFAGIWEPAFGICFLGRFE